MDLYKAIKDLQEEKKRLDRLIAAIEELLVAEQPPKRRGRKAMTAEERAEASKRMKEYWASRRKANDGATPSA